MDSAKLSVAGIVMLLGSVGTAIAWAWKAWTERFERREQLIQEAEARLRASSIAEIEKLQRQVDAMQAQLDHLRTTNAKQWTALHMLAGEIDPANPVLARAERVLGQAFFSIGRSEP